jgi:ABC-type transporter Mla MlaB component
LLKITEVSGNDSGRTLKLEGKLLGLWVEELRSICLQPLQGLEQIDLDLAAVTFVDAAGAKLLRELIQRGIAITRCSGFVAALLHVEEQ